MDLYREIGLLGMLICMPIPKYVSSSQPFNNSGPLSPGFEIKVPEVPGHIRWVSSVGLTACHFFNRKLNLSTNGEKSTLAAEDTDAFLFWFRLSICLCSLSFLFVTFVGDCRNVSLNFWCV